MQQGLDLFLFLRGKCNMLYPFRKRGRKDFYNKKKSLPKNKGQRPTNQISYLRFIFND